MAYTPIITNIETGERMRIVRECKACGEPLVASKRYENNSRTCEREDCRIACCDCCSQVYADGKRYCTRCTSEA